MLRDILECIYFRADKAALDIGMDLPGRLQCDRPMRNIPGVGFLGAGRKKSNQLQKLLSGMNQPVQAGFFQP